MAHSTSGPCAVTAAPALAPPAASPHRRRGRRGAAAPPAPGPRRFDEPVAPRVRIFFGYPLIDTRLLSFTHYDLLSPPALDRAAQLRATCSHGDQKVWPAVRNTLWFLGDRWCRSRCCSRSASRCRRRAPSAASASSARSSTCRRWRRRSPRRSASCSCFNPATGPVNTILGWFGITGPLWFNRPDLVQAVADAARPVGHRQHDDHLPGRDPRRPAPPATRRPSSTAPARGSGCAT